jgi:hypothetical protein
LFPLPLAGLSPKSDDASRKRGEDSQRAREDP